MLFSSLTFLYLFLPAVLLFYYLVFRKSRTGQNAFLFLASLFFYAWGEPKFVLVMLASILVNWFIGRAPESAFGQSSSVSSGTSAGVGGSIVWPTASPMRNPSPVEPVRG